MKPLSLTLSVAAALVAAGVSAVLQGQKAAQSNTSEGAAQTDRGHQALLNQYCLGCHSEAAKRAGLDSALRLTMDDLDAAHVEQDPEAWEKIVRKLRAGMMPPSGMPRPEEARLQQFVVDLEELLDRTAANAFPAPGLHRLNRAEYANAVRDLLGLQIDPARYLPSDDSTRGFDNIAGALTLSPALLESYVSAAAKISRIALGHVDNPAQTTYRIPEDASQEYHIEGFPFRTRGGIKIEHEFPATGEYIFKLWPVNEGNMDLDTAFGGIRGEKLELLIDGELIKLYDWDQDVGRGNAVRNGTEDVRVPITAGRHTVIVTFLATHYPPVLDLNQHFLNSTLETGGLPGFVFYPQLGQVMIEGPHAATSPDSGPDSSMSRDKILVCRPQTQAEEPACAARILSTLARRAFRREVTQADLDVLMRFYEDGRSAAGSGPGAPFDQGIELALNRILADPEFVFRKESPPPGISSGETYRLSDVELASRLSFFLWSSIPDDELLSAAIDGRLRDPRVLEQQVRRMLADPRSEAMIRNFAGQWLSLRALQTQVPTPALYPDFDDNLRQAFLQEAEMFVDSVIREDRSVIDLLDADYTFVNERLARQYGMTGIYGSRFRRVELGEEFSMRRGLLGKGALLAISSAPNRNSPVIRGKTVMQVFLGVEPPAPPPDVPDLKPIEDSVHKAKPTMRQQMELHRRVEPCASCHKIMDPIGLALENFDAVGRWRLAEDGQPIDASGVLVDGTEMDGLEGLRDALVKYSPQFVRVVTEKLMIYALGRGTEYYDMPVVRSIVRDAAAEDYRFSSLVVGIVKSEPFQMNRKGEENNQSAAR